jgi:transposase InsO family protein
MLSYLVLLCFCLNTFVFHTLCKLIYTEVLAQRYAIIMLQYKLIYTKVLAQRALHIALLLLFEMPSASGEINFQKVMSPLALWIVQEEVLPVFCLVILGVYLYLCTRKFFGHLSSKGSKNYAFLAKYSGLQNNEWYIDSGATRHYTKDLKSLRNVKPVDDSLTVANGEKLKITAIGDVLFDMKLRYGRSHTVLIRDVHYAPEISSNLISEGVLDDKDLEMNRKKGVMTYRDERGNFVFTAVKDEMKLWPVNGEVVREKKCMAEVVMGRGSLWHRRMGHIGDEALEKLARNGIVHGKVEFESNKDKCEICALSKAPRRTFESSKNPKARHPMDIVHIDLIEVENTSRCNEIYALVMVDDCSGAKFAYPLVKKSDAVNALRNWLPWAERVADRKLKCLRSDNARELKFGEMQQFLDGLGVERQFSQAYEHEQNGKVERANRTIMDKARSMLIDSQLEKQYWRDALTSAVFVANRTPSKNQSLTPIELFTGIKPDISRIRVLDLDAGPENTPRI